MAGEHDRRGDVRGVRRAGGDRREAERLDAPIAVGVTEDSADGTQFVNAQVVVAPDGVVYDRYEKVRRVPFGEYVPLRSLLEALGAPVDQIGRDAVAGTGPAVVELPDGTELGVVISWEVFFGGRAREGVKLGAEAILNPTNGSSYTGTIVQTQQVASSRLRAVENGRWVVQAAPTGFTAVIDADGECSSAHRSASSGSSTPTSNSARGAPGTRISATADHRRAVVILLVSMWFGGRFDRVRHRHDDPAATVPGQIPPDRRETSDREALTPPA